MLVRFDHDCKRTSAGDRSGDVFTTTPWRQASLHKAPGLAPGHAPDDD